MKSASDMVDRSTAWEIKESDAISGVYSVGRIDAKGRRVSVYDNWYSLDKGQAEAIAYALNVVEAKRKGEI
jgi:hypothetical protein